MEWLGGLEILTRARPRKLLQFVTLPMLVLLAAVKAEIRCYCNQPACVSTGYMCKSAAGTCFSERANGLQGCLEFRRKRCPAALRCCHEDMCNYVDTVDIDIKVHTNHSPLSGPFGGPESELEAALHPGVWFKAAVIAVPIGGLCILAIVVMLAARVLKQDTRRQKRFVELRRQHQLYRNVSLAHHHHHFLEGHSLKDTLLPPLGKCKDTTIV